MNRHCCISFDPPPARENITLLHFLNRRSTSFISPVLLQRWRRRWFVLEKATEGQFVLNYYTDESKRKLKGTICLDECEQVK